MYIQSLQYSYFCISNKISKVFLEFKTVFTTSATAPQYSFNISARILKSMKVKIKVFR